jgi:hypothetical protein
MIKSTLLVARPLRAGTRDSVRIAAALALTMALSTVPLRAFAQGPPTVAPNPGVVVPPIPILPPGNLITAFSKDAIGETPQARIDFKVCHNQITEEISGLSFRLTITPGPCDESFSRALLNGTLVCTVDIVRRRDDLRGCFSGKWQLLSSSGALLAAGEMDGTVGCGTHRPPGTAPCEECHDPMHYEGRLTGTVLLQGAYQQGQICATLAGTGPLQPSTVQRMSIEGIVISRCVPNPLVGG